MALPYIINAAEVDAKSPITDSLMAGIKADLDYLDSIATGGSVLFQFNANGALKKARFYRAPVDTAVSFADFTPSICRAVLKKSGTSGLLKFDLRKLSRPKTPIIGIDHQFEGATQSIARLGSSISTQSIQRSIAQINTQSISFARSSLSIQSIINVGTNLWRYNFSGSVLDADYAIGRFITVASATAGGNNGTFAIVEVNQSGFPSIVVSNASGVSQTSPAGTAQLQLMSYNFLNPVNADYVVGEDVLFASHTTGANNGRFPIYKTNELGNNILIYNQTGVVQAGVAGTSDCERWIFAYSSAVNATHYVIGENALLASHSSANNNGNKKIVDVNRAGNNLVIYNSNGVVQGGAAGNANSNRWIYALSTDPSSQVIVGDRISFESHTNPLNNLIAAIVIVNDSASNNLVIYNEAGVAQAGVAGTPRHTRKLVKFSSDQSANYTTDSFVEIFGAQNSAYNQSDFKDQFKVLEVNRGGGANYNIVIISEGSPSQPNEAGYITTEAKSIFNAPPEISADLTGANPDKVLRISSNNFVAGDVTTSTPLLLYLLEIPVGDPEDLTVILS